MLTLPSKPAQDISPIKASESGLRPWNFTNTPSLPD